MLEFLPLSFASQQYLIAIEILIAHSLVFVEAHSLSKHFLVLLLSQLTFFPVPQEKANLENLVQRRERAREKKNMS